MPRDRYEADRDDPEDRRRDPWEQREAAMQRDDEDDISPPRGSRRPPPRRPDDDVDERERRPPVRPSGEGRLRDEGRDRRPPSRSMRDDRPLPERRGADDRREGGGSRDRSYPDRRSSDWRDDDGRGAYRRDGAGRGDDGRVPDRRDAERRGGYRRDDGWDAAARPSRDRRAEDWRDREDRPSRDRRDDDRRAGAGRTSEWDDEDRPARRSRPPAPRWDDDDDFASRAYGARPRSPYRTPADREDRPVRRRAPAWDDEDSRAWPQARRSPRRFTEVVPRAATILTEAVEVRLRGLDKLLGGRLSRHPWLRVVLVLSLILAIVGPIALTGFVQVEQLKTLATNGEKELFAIKDLVSATTKALPPTATLEDKAKAVLQPAILAQMQQHAANARGDFAQLSGIVESHPGLLAIVALTPFVDTLAAVDRVAKVGVDVSVIAEAFAVQGAAFAPIFASSLFATTGPPIFTPTTFTAFTQFLAGVQPQIDDAAQQLSGLNLSKLPLSAKQVAEFAQILPVIPNATRVVDVAVANTGALRWLLGVDQPRRLLLQTMDRGEIRPTGGFTGQFGTLAITGGRLGSISLSDVNTIDQSPKNIFACDLCHDSPDAYRSWWPFVGFGLRDANLSADFPTSAKLSEYYFSHEGEPTVDGVITFSPLVIEHLLEPDILGPLKVPCYNVTVTADNLEDELHYYQLGGGGDAQQAQCAKSKDTTQRKQFTAAMALQLENQLRGATPERLGKVLASFSTDLQYKQMQLYFNDSATEAYLHSINLDGTLIRDPKIDTTAVIHTNDGGNKGSVYVTLTQQEQITLDAAGNAQHDLTLTMDYKPVKNVYGFSNPPVVTYRDYLRVYVPANAQLISGGGFDQNTSSPLCYDGRCTPKGAPVCSPPPAGAYVGPSPYYWPLNNAQLSGSVNNTIDDIGGPTNTDNSDFPGMGMFAGLVVIPPFCTLTVTVKWTVPNAVSNGTYTYLEQSQSDVFTDLTVDITGKGKIHDQVSPLLHNESWQMG